jgi:hypothetical protein
MNETTGRRFPLRWLNLGEIVGVLAVIIAALGLWENHREHAEAQKEHAAEIAAGALKDTFLMTGALAHNGAVVRLTSVHPDQVIQTQTVWFPAAIRAGSVETTGNPRLEAAWVEQGVRKTSDGAKEGRVPVGVETVYIEDGQTKTDNAVYELAYSLHPRLLLGDKVELEGLSLARRGVTGGLQGAVNSLWAAHRD